VRVCTVNNIFVVVFTVHAHGEYQYHRAWREEGIAYRPDPYVHYNPAKMHQSVVELLVTQNYLEPSAVRRNTEIKSPNKLLLQT